MTDERLGPNLGISLTGATQERVVRRNRRRVVIRRSTIYINTLPAGCVRTLVNGSVVWRCGSAYYQPYQGTRYVVVYVN